MGCGSYCMKCILNALNILLGLFGILVIVLATMSLHSAPQSFIYYLYIVGTVTLLTALIGCCGICQEDVCMTTIYSMVILVLLISQVIGKFYVVDSAAIRKFAQNDVTNSWNEEKIHPGAMNNTQQTYDCCGLNGPSDYILIGRPSYPLSCFPENKFNATALYNDGCVEAAEREFLKIFNYSSTGQWANLIFTSIMFVFSVSLLVRFRRKQRRYNY